MAYMFPLRKVKVKLMKLLPEKTVFVTRVPEMKIKKRGRPRKSHVDVSLELEDESPNPKPRKEAAQGNF